MELHQLAEDLKSEKFTLLIHNLETYEAFLKVLEDEKVEININISPEITNESFEEGPILIEYNSPEEYLEVVEKSTTKEVITMGEPLDFYKRYILGRGSVITSSGIISESKAVNGELDFNETLLPFVKLYGPNKKSYPLGEKIEDLQFIPKNEGTLLIFENEEGLDVIINHLKLCKSHFKKIKNSKYRTLLPHQQRVLDEADDLEVKLLDLRKFIAAGTIYDTLPILEQSNLVLQESSMSEYLNILRDRISNF